MTKGSNPTFQYQFMVRPLVVVHTSKSLRIFWMRNITLYMVCAVVPQCLVHCTPTLPGNDQCLILFPYGKLSFASKERQCRPFSQIGAQFSLYFVCSCMSCNLMFESCCKVVVRMHILYCRLCHCIHFRHHIYYQAPGV